MKWTTFHRRHFKCIFFSENVRISTKISLKFVRKGPINNILTLVQIMAWRRPGKEALSEPMMVSLPTHICVARYQWHNYEGLVEEKAADPTLTLKPFINTLRPRQMAAIFQTTFSNAFSWMKMYQFRLRFHWSLFPRAKLTIFQHWFR